MPRTEYTYDQIKPLIVSEEVEGRKMFAEFALPGSDQVFEASASIRRSRDMGSMVKQQVSRSVVREVRRTVGSLLRGLLGGGMLGRTARQVVNTTTNQQARNLANAPSRSEKEAAVVEAFGRVASNFHFDAASGGWRSPSLAGAAGAAPSAKAVEKSAFEQQLDANPVNDKFARSVLARMLAHIAYADGSIADEEKEFFTNAIPAEYGDLASLANADPISAVESEEIARGARESIYAMAWVISAIDMDVDPAEVALLTEYGNKFAIPAARQKELETTAKTYVLEGYLSVDISREDLFALAAKVDLSQEDAERAKIRWIKRQ
ncbi:MAG: hypothetical protein AAGN35_19350 [Bacteroidota bacterium]